MTRDELYHHGIKGMRWGVRRYQNADGTLTPKGEKRYYGKANALQKDIDSFAPIKNGLKTKKGKQLLTSKDVSDSVRALEKQRDAARAKGDALRERDLQKMQRREQIRNSDALKKFAKGAAITAGVALAAYGGYKLAKAHPDAINNAKSAVSKMFSKNNKTADKNVKDIKVTLDAVSVLSSKPSTSSRNSSNDAIFKNGKEIDKILNQMGKEKDPKKSADLSVRLAELSGVSEDNILRNIDEADRYFTTGSKYPSSSSSTTSKSNKTNSTSKSKSKKTSKNSGPRLITVDELDKHMDTDDTMVFNSDGSISWRVNKKK